jgi:hypothetical protein
MKAAPIAVIVVFFLCSPAAVPVALAKGGGHGGGGQSGGHAGGQSGGHAAATHGSPSSGSHASGGSRAGTSAPPTSAAPAHERCTRPATGTAVPRANTTDVFRATPFTYAPVYRTPYRVFGFVHPYSYGSLWPLYAVGSAYALSPCATVDCPGLPDETAAVAVEEPQNVGNLRLDVQPASAQVFVDGYFVGTVDDFYHTLAGLSLSAGPHHLEFRAPDYETLAVDVMIDANRTITYRATLHKE